MQLVNSGCYPFLISSLHFKYDFKSLTGFVAKKEAQRLSYAEARFFFQASWRETSTLITLKFNKMVAINPSNDRSF